MAPAAMAGMQIGGQMLSQWLQAEAERKEREKAMKVQAEQQLGQDQQKTLDNLMNYYRSALG